MLAVLIYEDLLRTSVANNTGVKLQLPFANSVFAISSNKLYVFTNILDKVS
jgi:hypothetical protein